MVLAHRRRNSLRLPTYDYTLPGAYFVTLVCKDRELLFDSPLFRQIAQTAWLELEALYEDVTLDTHVVMPNHFHGIIVLGAPRRGGSRTAPTAPLIRKPLGRLVGAFKTMSTKRINQIRGTPAHTVWQRNYHERVIRHERELNAVREYILDNPRRWAEDVENPDYRRCR
ncbi:MAG: transposase [Dehalococcoidia bacterium]|nr:transposase [Dehalococcoidia bacterium]